MTHNDWLLHLTLIEKRRLICFFFPFKKVLEAGHGVDGLLIIMEQCDLQQFINWSSI